MKKLFIALFVLFLTTHLKAQPKVDSLLMVWEDKLIADTTRADAFIDYIYTGYFNTKPDTAIQLADQIYHFCEKINYCIGMVDALNLSGYLYFRVGKYPEALQAYNKGLSISERANYKSGTADILLRIGFIYHDNEDVITGLSYYERSLKIFEEINDVSGIGSVYNEFGSIYRMKGEYDKSLNYYLKSIEINKKLNDEYGNAAMYDNIGSLFLEQKEFPKALDYYLKGLVLYEQKSDKLGIAGGLSGVGNVYGEQGNYDLALDYLKRSLAIDDEIGNLLGSSTTLLDMGKFYGKQGKYLESIQYCEKGLELAKTLGDIGNQENACDFLFTSYKELGNDKKALYYLEQKQFFTESLKTEQTAMKIQQMEFRKQAMADSLIQVEKDLKLEMVYQSEIRKKDKNRNLAIGFGLFFLILSGGFYSRWNYIKKSKVVLQKEKDRSENLLLNILPAEIAEELKEKGEAAARNFEQVSILFTDFKGFTKKSEQLTAKELIEEINHCFKAFDLICEKYGVEKIKTIGDAYMAAGGIPALSKTATRNTVLAALEMQSFVSNRMIFKQSNNETAFEMRLGIHTGPVVAGIVGVKKFQYDIWGDTVNTASRMESSGEIGKVNISQNTYEILKNDPMFTFEYRGKIEAKGKGEMEMWFVEMAKR